MAEKSSEDALSGILPHLADRDRNLHDYRISCLSRELSLMLRKEVLTGKAKFGIGGAGKELPQMIMARAFQKGDFWAGYYRDQTFMLAKDLVNPASFFAFLYGDTRNDPFSGGRQMNNCYGLPLIDKEGNWLTHTEQYNISSTMAPVAGQLTHAIGLALASKKYRENHQLKEALHLSHYGNEVCFATIGDAGTAEGVFWETVNAAAVMQIPLAIFVWDDGYGISVPAEYQVAKSSISEVLAGFQVGESGNGIDLYTAKAWDYDELQKVIPAGIRKIRNTHIPAVFHIQECTQPQGHSTSGSHERYKSHERLLWEQEYDCIRQMEKWMRTEGIATRAELEAIQQEALAEARKGRKEAWAAFRKPIDIQRSLLQGIYQRIARYPDCPPEVLQLVREEQSLMDPVMSHLAANARRMNLVLPAPDLELEAWLTTAEQKGAGYHSHLYSESQNSPLQAPVIPASYAESAPKMNGFEILQAFFDKVMERDPTIYAFGEDVGRIGDVNQGMAGLQEKHGESRIFDTGIREWTIVGQAIGMAMRGLRPIAEIQYLDYLAYAFAALTDDLATLRYRSNGTQMAPAIIRTRGHRLEGIWHSGSPMGMILHSMRGVHVLVPRNMTQAAGMYNTLLQGDDPAIVIECLNGYRQKEPMPENIGDFTVPLGIPEVLQEGNDVTLITYGACVRVAKEGIALLDRMGISVELIDVQSLLPFDREHRIRESLAKTNRILFLDEDVPGGATAFMMQQALEVQGGYELLDSLPATLTGTAHRPAYADDGNYYSKPNAEDVAEKILEIMRESEPGRFQ